MSFDLYNLIPLPIKTNSNSHIFIIPSTSLIALSETKLQYTAMTDLGKCKKLSESLLICKLINPVFSVHNILPICETQILVDGNKIPESCDTRLSVFDKEIWHRLHNSNSSIYVSPNLIAVTLNCKNHKPFDVHVINTGILTLIPNCKGYTSTTVLSTYTIVKESTHLSLLPIFDIISDDCCHKVNQTNVTQLNLTPIHNNVNLENLQISCHKLDEISKIVEKLADTKNAIHQILNDNYFSIFVVTTLKLLALYIIYRLYCYFKKRLSKRSKPTG